MIQKLLPGLLGLFLLQACSSTDAPPPSPASYIIQGTVDSLHENRQITLAIFDPITQVKTGVDTAEVADDGSYQLEFMLEEPDLFQVNFFGKQSVMLAIDEGQNAIQLDAEGINKGSVSISGSEDSQKLLDYDEFRAASGAKWITTAYTDMRKASKEEDQEAEVAAVLTYAQNSKTHRKELIDFTKENIGTSIALYGTALRWTGDDQVERLEELVNAFAEKHPDLKMTTAMQNKVERYKKIAIGAKAPEISQPDQDGNTVSLYESMGTYTLIDFWASWCGPCLLQVPDLKEAQASFGDQGFQIFSVSADTDGEKWRAAIEEYDLNWPNVSDLKGWESAAANNYNVTFLPFNLLIDSKGNIVAKNLHSKALQTKLAELYSK